MFHKVLPHVHHIHQEKSSPNEVAHSHGHHHHHHEDPMEQEANQGLFDWFLNVHTHTNIGNDYLVFDSITIKKVKAQNDLLKANFNYPLYIYFYKNDEKIVEWEHPPDKLQKAYLFNYSLRGPPVLG